MSPLLLLHETSIGKKNFLSCPAWDSSKSFYFIVKAQKSKQKVEHQQAAAAPAHQKLGTNN